jgi:hypothetical protein
MRTAQCLPMSKGYGAVPAPHPQGWRIAYNCASILFSLSISKGSIMFGEVGSLLRPASGC